MITLPAFNESWTKNEIALVREGFEKAKEIQTKIDFHLSVLAHIPRVEEKYPEITNEIKTILPERKKEECSDDIRWIEQKVTKHLVKTGQVEVTGNLVDLMKEGNLKVTNYLRKMKGPDVNFDDYNAMRTFLLASDKFVRKNIESFKQDSLFKRLVGIDYDVSDAIKNQQFGMFSVLVGALDAIAIEKSNQELIKYESLVSVVERTLLAGAVRVQPQDPSKKSCPEHIGKEISNKAIGFVKQGVALHQNFVHAPNEVKRNEAACAVFKQHTMAGSLVSTPLQLAAMVRASLESKEFPGYFKAQALKLSCKLAEI